MVFILSSLWRIRIRGPWKLPDGSNWSWGNLDLALMGGAMLSKSLTQFSIDRQGCVLSRSVASGQTMVGVMMTMATSFKRTYTSTLTPRTVVVSAQLHCRPLSTHASAWDSWKLTVKSGSVSCAVTAPFSWVLVHTRFCLCPPRVCFPSPVEVL